MSNGPGLSSRWFASGLLSIAALAATPSCLSPVDIAPDAGGHTDAAHALDIGTSLDVGTPPESLDASSPDIGIAPFDAEVPSPDVGSDGGGESDASTADASVQLTITAARDHLAINVGDSDRITVQLMRDHVPMANEPITLSTDWGALYVSDPSSAQSSLFLTTDDLGGAIATFVETATPPPADRVANISATHAPSNSAASIPIQIVSIATIVYKGMTCGGTPCINLGLKGSGWNETGKLTFQVLDETGKGISNVTVSFSVSGNAIDTTVSNSSPTDNYGNAYATLSAGEIRGIATVKAVVGGLAGNSDPIGVRGAKPSNFNFILYCDAIAIPTNTVAIPPKNIQVNCSVMLRDSLNDPIGRPTMVYFMTEAGTIPAAVSTLEFDPKNPDDPNEGRAQINYVTVGVNPPADVEPLAADPNQLPSQRFAEPSYQNGALTRNPRDMLVTILAWTEGEEYQISGGPTFIDQSTPFLDVDDDGEYDSSKGDQLLQAMAFSPANGIRDANTMIWTEAKILWTGFAITPSFLPNVFDVQKGTSQDLSFFFPDLFLNRVAPETVFNAWHSASKGSASLSSSITGYDDYGFDLRRVLVDAKDDNSDCTMGQSAICHWRWIFGQWGAGYAGKVTVTGAPTGDTTPAEPDTLSVSATELGVTLPETVNGTIE